MRQNFLASRAVFFQLQLVFMVILQLETHFSYYADITSMHRNVDKPQTKLQVVKLHCGQHRHLILRM